jgi:tetratricopeptide (TPR) repeat protein
LATGFAQLPFSPDKAIEIADRADRASPGRAGPWVLRGRAHASKKGWEEARAAFERARSIDAQSLEDPLTMREWARALARVGRAKEALAVYRTLGPRLSAIVAPDERARTFLEAAELGFALGPEGLDDAIAFLGEAKQLAGRELEWRVGAELALALDRKGAKDEALGLVTDLARRFRKDARPASAAENAEEQAATALVLETIDARRALEAWDKYIAAVGERAPFGDHAQKRAAALRKRAGDAPRGGR